MKKTFLMLPLIALLVSCGGGESESDGVESEDQNEVVEEVAEVNKSFILIQRIEGELGQYEYNEIKKINGDDCLDYMKTDHEYFELTISLKNEVDIDTETLLSCLEGQKFDKETFTNDEEVFKANVLAKTDQEIKWKKGSGSNGTEGKITFRFELY